MLLATSFTIFVSLLAIVKGQSAMGDDDDDDPSLPAASDDPSKKNVVPIVVPIVVVIIVIGLLTCGSLVMYRRSRRNGNNNLKLMFFGKTPTLALDTASSDEEGQEGDRETRVETTTQEARKAASKKNKKRNGPQNDIIIGEGSLPIDSKELAAVVSNFFHGLPDEPSSEFNHNNTSQQPKKTRQPSLGTTAIRILEAAGADHDIDIELAAAQEAEEYSVYSGSTLSIFGDSTQASGNTREHQHHHHDHNTSAGAPPEVRLTAKAAAENDGWTAFRQEAEWPSGSSVEKVVGKKRHVRCSLHI